MSTSPAISSLDDHPVPEWFYAALERGADQGELLSLTGRYCAERMQEAGIGGRPDPVYVHMLVSQFRRAYSDGQSR